MVWRLAVLASCCLIVPIAQGVSAFRPETESYLQTAKHHKKLYLKTHGPLAAGVHTAYESAVALKDLDTSTLASLSDTAQLFAAIRDPRWLEDPDSLLLERRIPWLYPVDGCWIRAALAATLAESKAFTRPEKLFIFGDLKASTANAVSGSVTWWYHVAPIAKDSSGKSVILDPALDAKEPLSVEDWAKKMVSKVEDATFSLCATFTYGPYDDCAASTSGEESGARDDIRSYLSLERSNLTDLGRDADAELGDEPPWR